MKLNNTILFNFCINLLMITGLEAKIGCMDISSHLKCLGDPKTYRFVQCNCPCPKTLNIRNQCLFCSHVHDALPLVIIQSRASSLPTSPEKFQSVEKIMKTLIHNYQYRKPTW